MRKLVLFDLDSTLVDARAEPLSTERSALFPKQAWIVVQGVWIWVYMRPWAAEVLLAIRAMGPSVALSICSAGNDEYVREIIDKVVLPAVIGNRMAVGTPFYFDCIYTRADLDGRGIKRIGDALDQHEADVALLVDDLAEQCRHATIEYGEYALCVPAFDASEPGSEFDRCLAAVLEHEFFRLTDVTSPAMRAGIARPPAPAAATL